MRGIHFRILRVHAAALAGEAMEKAGDSKPIEPWRDPELADFYTARDERLTVQLGTEATKAVWDAYIEGRDNNIWYLLMFTMDGKTGMNPHLTEDLTHVIGIALHRRLCVYNVRRRKCWRPVWAGSCLIDKRSINNLSYEPVTLLGWKSFIDGWEKRPRAKLFAND